MKFLICMTLTLIAVALIDGTRVRLGHQNHCSDKCVSTSTARKECRFKSSCTLNDCRLSKRSRGKRCSPKIVAHPLPPPPPPASCPRVCKASHKVKRECRRLGRKCKVSSCTYTHRGRVSHGSSCVDAYPPPPPSHSCPQKCLSRRIGTQQCNHSIYRIHCVLVSCARTVRGRSRPGVQCVPKAVIPTPRPKVCPEQCGSRRSAKRQCRKSPFLSICEVRECSLRPHGNVEYGYICTRGDVTTSPPTSTTTTTTTESTTTTTTTPPTTTATTASTTNATMTTTTTMSSCPPCLQGHFITFDGTCGCSANPCDACPDEAMCQTAENASGSEVMVCMACDCGYCDPTGESCCRSNANGVNCVPNAGANNQECQVSDFVISIVGNSNANVCRGEEKPSTEFVNTCGCVPSGVEACSLPANSSGNCFVERVQLVDALEKVDLEGR